MEAAAATRQFDFAEILTRMAEERASDVHLTPGYPPAIRVRGKIVGLDEYGPLSSQLTRDTVYSLLNDDQRKRFESHKQLDLAYAVPGVARFRVNCFFQRGSISAAFRRIPHQIPRLDELGLPRVLEEMTRKPRGLVLVTGPTGSGKSTTLAAMLDIINQERDEHILTIEDPIEFLHTHKPCIVNQREIGADAEDFASALKSALREDPDVILVGEMRDLETMSTALTAAETGHLVFATLHTQSTAQTVDRIIDIFPAQQQAQVRMQLSIGLQGIVTQQLLPTVDGAGPGGGLRGPGPDPGGPQPDPRGQDAPDLLRDPDLGIDRDADDGRASRAAGPYGADLAPARRAAGFGARGAQAAARAEPERRRPGSGRDEQRRLKLSTFSFRAVDVAGVPSRGEVDAESKGQVSEQLRERGLIVLDVSEKSEALRLESFLDRFRGIKTRDLSVFARQFSTLVASGMPMLRSLYTLEDQTEDERLKDRDRRGPK